MAKASESEDDKGTPIFTVWKAYEDVAMHFNDLLLKLRIQALGGVAALAVLASVFSNFRSYYFQGTWVLAAACFFGLLLIWCAIWALDRLYYNRLLIGSVIAIAAIEQLSKTETHIKELDLSTRIGQAIEWKTHYGILDGSETVRGVRIPDLPGVHGSGPTPEAAIEDAISAAREWIAHHGAKGLQIPTPRLRAAILPEVEAGERIVETGSV